MEGKKLLPSRTIRGDSALFADDEQRDSRKKIPKKEGVSQSVHLLQLQDAETKVQ